MDRGVLYAEKLAAWLAARGLAGSHGGIFSTPTRSPYQW